MESLQNKIKRYSIQFADDQEFLNEVIQKYTDLDKTRQEFIKIMKKADSGMELSQQELNKVNYHTVLDFLQNFGDGRSEYILTSTGYMIETEDGGRDNYFAHQFDLRYHLLQQKQEEGCTEFALAKLIAFMENKEEI